MIMKNNKKLVTLILITASVVGTLFSQGTNEISEITNEISEITNPDASSFVEQVVEKTDQIELFGASAAQNSDGFTLEEMLQYAIEDERLALAEYAFIMNEFNVSRPFSNIIKAEGTHERALLNLYETYGYPISDFDASSHVIIPNSLGEIYDVGVEAEIANIAMYDLFLTYELPSDVRNVFEALKRGSISHLEAFQRQSSKY